MINKQDEIFYMLFGNEIEHKRFIETATQLNKYEIISQFEGFYFNENGLQFKMIETEGDIDNCEYVNFTPMEQKIFFSSNKMWIA